MASGAWVVFDRLARLEFRLPVSKVALLHNLRTKGRAVTAHLVSAHRRAYFPLFSAFDASSNPPDMWYHALDLKDGGIPWQHSRSGNKAVSAVVGG